MGATDVPAVDVGARRAVALPRGKRLATVPPPMEPPITTDLAAKPAVPIDLEIKDAQIIFNQVWKKLESEHGRARLRFPKELILLGGAPGAGKGTNTDFIRELRGITAPPIVVSQLLNSPAAAKLKAQGGMVGDREVVGILFRKLLEPDQQNGAILDGFPRTKVQVECLKMLFDEMIALRREFSGTPEAADFKQPVFHISNT